MSKKQYDFIPSLINGKEGERIIIDWFSLQDFCRRIEDVSDDKEYQKKDIDFLLTANAKVWAVEIKTDSYLSGNIFWEIYSCLERKTPGCLEKTEADVLAYFLINRKRNQLYLFNTNKLRKWVHENIDSFRRSEVGNGIYNTLGVIIPIKSIPKKLYRLETIDKFYY